VKVYRN